MALNSFKNLRISPSRTVSRTASKKSVKAGSCKSEERKKTPKPTAESEKKTSSKDESSLATAPEHHENMNGKAPCLFRSFGMLFPLLRLKKI